MDKYENIGIAGEGNYGIVLKCRSRHSGEIVAIKQFKENDKEDEEAARVIQREIKLLKTLKHEYIVSIREVFREKGLLHVVCEYVDTCLLDVLDAHPGGLGTEITRKIIYQLTRALEHCHRHKVIHRDIKPDNLLINAADNSLKLCDFGSACAVAGQQVLTDYVATRWYRAPELLVRFNNYGPGVDMWAMGCVMAELVAGQPLFAGETDLDQLFIIINALGPLTPEQTKRCFDLTGFIKFPEAGERQTLAKRLGRLATDQQMRFLSRIFVADPTERLTANTALSLPWLTDWSASSPPLAVSPPAESYQTPRAQAQAASDPDFGLQPKPRITKVVGVSGADAVRGQPAVGLAVHSCKAPAATSVQSLQTGTAVQHSSDLPSHDSCEILEEISEGSILEDLADSCGSHDSSPVRVASATAASCEALSPSAAVAHDGYSVGISGCAAESVELQGSKVSGQTVTRSALNPQESIATLPTLSQDHMDDSIVEELPIHDHAIDEPSVEPMLMPRQTSPAASRASSKPSSQLKQHIRPISSSSARTSSLTPMS